jgi:hypothetical protein
MPQGKSKRREPKVKSKLVTSSASVPEAKPAFADIQSEPVIPPSQKEKNLTEFTVNDRKYTRVGSVYYGEDDNGDSQVVKEGDYFEALAIYNSINRTSPIEIRSYLPKFMEEYAIITQQCAEADSAYEKVRGTTINSLSKTAQEAKKKAHSELNKWMTTQKSLSRDVGATSKTGAWIKLKWCADGKIYPELPECKDEYDAKQINSVNMTRFYAERNANELEAALIENRYLQRSRYANAPPLLVSEGTQYKTGGGTTSGTPA